MLQQTQDQAAATRLELVPLSNVSPQPGFNPRTKRDKAKFAALQADIAANGVDQSILVKPDPDHDGHYLVIAGESRYLAALDAGHPFIPCSIREQDSPVNGLDRAVAENL